MLNGMHRGGGPEEVEVIAEESGEDSEDEVGQEGEKPKALVKHSIKISNTDG
jgi:hypothetical protein